MTDYTFFSALLDCVRQGGTLVLCTVVDSAGSAPRGAGARMALLPDGVWLGTVGGRRSRAPGPGARRPGPGRNGPGRPGAPLPGW